MLLYTLGLEGARGGGCGEPGVRVIWSHATTLVHETEKGPVRSEMEAVRPCDMNREIREHGTRATRYISLAFIYCRYQCAGPKLATTLLQGQRLLSAMFPYMIVTYCRKTQIMCLIKRQAMQVYREMHPSTYKTLGL